jgi:hypothetical protein
VSLFYSSHLSITSIIPPLADDGIFDFLNSLPTLGLLQHDYLIQLVKVANSFFVVTRKSPSCIAQIDGSGSSLSCKLDLDFTEFRSLIDVQHRGCDKAGSLRLLAIRGGRPLDFDDRVGFLAEAFRTAPTVLWRRHPCLPNAFSMKAFVANIAQQHLVRALIEVFAATNVTTCVKERANGNVLASRR